MTRAQARAQRISNFALRQTKKPVKYYPQPWQQDPANITTEKVQYWYDGTMRTAQMKLADAQRLVSEGKAFVISSQAIGVIIDGECKG